MAKIDYERMRFNERGRGTSEAPSEGPSPGYPPSSKQLALIRKLLAELGEERVMPRTSRQASALIRLLLARKGTRRSSLGPSKPWGV